jgi:myo-inositol 2-dehydrogenase/D-chiro-inositol 1-dehydrogenase
MRGDRIGLAIIGCGSVGRLRAMLARETVAVEWLGLCDLDDEVAQRLAADTHADFVTTDFRELLAQPQVTAAIIATAENEHVSPILAAVELGVPLFIEKPLASDLSESARVLKAIEASGTDAVVGYTQRFRRRFQTVKQRLRDGQIGEVTSVVTRAFMNRMVPLSTLSRTDRRDNLTPMVVSGTHSLDISMWFMEGKVPIEVYARSVDTTLGHLGTKDATFGLFTMHDGSLWSMNISWALPVVWPGSVYGLEIGIVGTRGVIDIEDTHRDVILASDIPQTIGHSLRAYRPEDPRHVDFIGSYPPGDISDGLLWGPMREETLSWYNRLTTKGLRTPHATVADGHRNLMLTIAMDESARTGKPVPLPLVPGLES